MRVIYVRGEPLALTLPTGGCVDNDWDSSLNAGCLLHWMDQYSWCLERGEIRGGNTSRHWGNIHSSYAGPSVGFRPVLTPLDLHLKFPKEMNGHIVRLGYVEGSWDDFRIIDVETGIPADCGIFNGKLIALDNWFDRVSWDSLIKVYDKGTPMEIPYCFVLAREFDNNIADIDVFSNEEIAHTAMIGEVTEKEEQLKALGHNPVKKISSDEVSIYDPFDRVTYKWMLWKKQIF